MRFVKAVSMLAGVALLLLGLADLIARRADVADRRDRADATATELAAARFDDLLASTTRALRVVGSDADIGRTSAALGVPVCTGRGTPDAVTCADELTTVLDAAARSPAATASEVVPESDGSEPRRVAIAVSDHGRQLAAVVSLAGIADRAHLVPGIGVPDASPLATRFTSGGWSVRLDASADEPGAGIGLGGVLVAGQLVVGAALVLVTVVISRREHRGLRRRASTDSLTGLPNRAEFERRATAVLSRAARDRSGACLLVVDLDRFKAINDTLGHSGGDRVLIEAAGRLRSAVRETDLVGRWGGDEFVILLVGVGDPLAIPDRAAAIRRSLAGIPTIDGGQLTAAVGAAVSPIHGTDLTTLLEVADQAMYAVKPGGVRAGTDTA